MKNKKNILYKFGLTIVLAIFVFALYFNNQTTINKLKNKNKAAAAVVSVEAGEVANAVSAGDVDDVVTTGAEASAVTTGAVADAVTTGAEADVIAASAVTADTATDADNASDTATNTTATNPVESTSAAAGVRDHSFNFNLYDINGNSTSFSDYRGATVFMVFWTPYNVDSGLLPGKLAAEAPDTGPAADSSKNEIAVISVCVSGGDDYNDAASLQYWDADAKLARLFQVTDYPTTFVFNPNGELRDYIIGDIDAAQMGRLAEQASVAAKQ